MGWERVFIWMGLLGFALGAIWFRFYPSSKTCSACGHKLEALALAVREWTCPACAAHHDRDVNAAVNLKNMAVSSTVSAGGEEGSGRVRKSAVKPASVKQEASGRFSQK